MVYSLNNYILNTRNIFSPNFDLSYTPAAALGSKCRLWLDHEDLNVSSLSGDSQHNLASLVDKSSNARIFEQVTAANRPTFCGNGARYERTFDFLVNNTSFISTIAGGFRVYATVISETEDAGNEGSILSECTFVSNSRPAFNFLCRAIATVRDRVASLYVNASGTTGGVSRTLSTTNIKSLWLNEFNLVSMRDTTTQYTNFVNGIQNIQFNYTRSGVLTGTNRTVVGGLLSSTTGLTSSFGGIIQNIVVTSNDLTVEEDYNLNVYLSLRASTLYKVL